MKQKKKTKRKRKASREEPSKRQKTANQTERKTNYITLEVPNAKKETMRLKLATILSVRDLFMQANTTEVDFSAGKHVLCCCENNLAIDGRLVVLSPKMPLLFLFQVKHTDSNRELRLDEVLEFCNKVTAIGNTLKNFWVIPVFISNRPCSPSMVSVSCLQLFSEQRAKCLTFHKDLILVSAKSIAKLLPACAHRFVDEFIQLPHDAKR